MSKVINMTAAEYANTTEAQTLTVLSSIDTHLGSIAQSLREQATETRLLRETISRHLHPRPARVVSVSRATYAGEETEFDQRQEATSALGKGQASPGSGRDIVGTGGVPGFRRR